MKVYKGKPNNVRRIAHKMPRKVAVKRKYECQDGPLKGQSLWLTDGKTAVFTINGQTGLYDNGEWQQC
jgi:hypothetical protein